jgi:hypothetical protein
MKTKYERKETNKTKRGRSEKHINENIKKGRQKLKARK